MIISFHFAILFCQLISFTFDESKNITVYAVVTRIVFKLAKYLCCTTPEINNHT